MGRSGCPVPGIDSGMADNKGLGTRDTHEWRNWKPFRPHVLSPWSRVLWWVLLPGWTVLLIAALVVPRNTSDLLLACVGVGVGVAASLANLARDIAGRRRRARLNARPESV